MIWKILGTCFGAGYFPIAPATFTSAIITLLIFLLLDPTSITYIVILALLLILGFFVCDETGKRYGGDDNKIVIDEAAGIFVSFLLIEKSWLIFLAGFFLFRVFDILKPPPVRNMEKLKGGWGIMLDDVMAGVYTNIVLSIICVFWK
ncbi:phosphatidylglycerophosphatase A [bacterium]|nr:phosphatidylglycerophosphatase A [bacterium]